jgi:molybdate transport system substrate-binding protein
MQALMNRSKLRFNAIVVAVIVESACKREPSLAASVPIHVAAAADLTLAFEEIGRDFERQTGRRVTFSFGSTGLLAKQLREGAPFDAFAAANVTFVDEVVAAGACDGATKAPYARGRIAVWTRRGSVAAPEAVADLGDARFARIAIANPKHAPYGQAARQALEYAGVWSKVEPRLVLGENIRQTLQFAETGNVEAAIVALALVAQDRENPWFLIDEAMHHPIDQALVVCTRGGDRQGGESFVRFLNTEAGRTVMRRFGFLLLGEDLLRSP